MAPHGLFFHTLRIRGPQAELLLPPFPLSPFPKGITEPDIEKLCASLQLLEMREACDEIEAMGGNERSCLSFVKVSRCLSAFVAVVAVSLLNSSPCLSIALPLPLNRLLPPFAPCRAEEGHRGGFQGRLCAGGDG